MSKTIGDLTLNQIIEISNSCTKYKNCKECKEKDKICYLLCHEDFDIAISDELLKQEIEVEEDE